MVGLVYAESLRLTPAQWTAMGLHAAGWLWWYHHSQLAMSNYQLSMVNSEWRMANDQLRRANESGVTALLTFSGLWYAFWNQWTSIDQQMLFEQARYLARFAWPEFLARFADRPYVQYQPPFVTFWYSRFPVFWQHQLVMLPFGLLCAGLMLRLYGRNAALLLATPVFALMIHQPCNDTLLFGLLLITLRLIQIDRTGRRDTTKHTKHTKTKMFYFSRHSCVSWFPAFVYGLTWPVKPLTILTAPFLLPRLGWIGLLSVGMWAGYVIWSLRWPFGQRQLGFVLHQLLLRSMSRSNAGRLPPRSSRPLWLRVFTTLRWRWQRLGRPALRALPFYLCPVYLRPWTWAGLLLLLMIVLGYGNCKYLMLDLLWVFPLINEE